jgi:hypothetical protein
MGTKRTWKPENKNKQSRPTQKMAFLKNTLKKYIQMCVHTHVRVCTCACVHVCARMIEPLACDLTQSSSFSLLNILIWKAWL